jgi:hypothetical protein
MSEESKQEVEYSIGVDLSRVRPLAATARGGSAQMATPPDPHTSAGPGETTQWQQVSTLVEQVIGRERSNPSAVVLAVAPLISGADDLARRLAGHLGLLPNEVVVIDRAVATRLGSPHVEASTAIDPSVSAAALGAALAGASPDRHRGGAALFAAGSGGAVAGLVGVVGATAIVGDPATATASLGPAGVPLSTSAAGPAGVPLASGADVGPAGVPLAHGAGAGPTGVPLASGAGVGPGGVPLRAAGWAPGRIGWMIGAAAVVAATVIGVIVVAANDDAPQAPTAAPKTASAVATTQLPTTTADVVTPVTAAPTVASTVAPTVVATTVANSSPGTSVSVVATVPAATTELVGVACTAGAWLGDNDSFGTAFASTAAADGAAIELSAVTGAVRLDIADDGTVEVTYEDWVLVAYLPGGAPSGVAKGGSETTAVTFASDGSFAVGASQINSTMTVSMAGTVFSDGPSLEPMLYAPGTYSCVGDQLVMTPADFPYPMIFTRDA